MSQKDSTRVTTMLEKFADAPVLERGIPIRSISRAIAVLQAINRGSSLTITEMSQATDLPYPTTCRIVQTLLHEGLIEREEARKRFRPTALVQTLAHGFQGHGPLVRASHPHILALTHEIGWPISLTTHVGHTMVLRDSTHAHTSLTFNAYYPGYAMPVLACAAGIVYLAYADKMESDSVLNRLSYNCDSETKHMIEIAREGGLLEAVRLQGHAARGFNSFTQNPGKTSSFAVPIFSPDGSFSGALTVAFFVTAIEIREAVKQFLGVMKECSEQITADLASKQEN